MVPFNKKRQQRARRRLVIEGLPGQPGAVRPVPRSGTDLSGLGAMALQELLRGGQIVGPCRPAERRERGQLAELADSLTPLLLRVRRPDLQIVMLPQRDQGVLRAASRMGAPEGRAHARATLQLFDPLLQIVDAEDDVV